MDQDTLVNNLRKMSDKIISDHKSVSLIMLLGNNIMEHTTSFDYIISAKWLNQYDQDKGIDLILDYLYDMLSVEDLKCISRVTLIHTDDPIVRDITENIGQRGGVAYNMNCQFGNLMIPFAIIFESRFEQ